MRVLKEKVEMSSPPQRTYRQTPRRIVTQHERGRVWQTVKDVFICVLFYALVMLGCCIDSVVDLIL